MHVLGNGKGREAMKSQRRVARRLLAGLLLLSLLFGALPSSAGPDTVAAAETDLPPGNIYEVTNTDNSGIGSLRQAVACANGAGSADACNNPAYASNPGYRDIILF